jgi:hypothetical protein
MRHLNLLDSDIHASFSHYTSSFLLLFPRTRTAVHQPIPLPRSAPTHSAPAWVRLKACGSARVPPFALPKAKLWDVNVLLEGKDAEEIVKAEGEGDPDLQSQEGGREQQRERTPSAWGAP